MVAGLAVSEITIAAVTDRPAPALIALGALAGTIIGHGVWNAVRH